MKRTTLGCKKYILASFLLTVMCTLAPAENPQGNRQQNILIDQNSPHVAQAQQDLNRPIGQPIVVQQSANTQPQNAPGRVDKALDRIFKFFGGGQLGGAGDNFLVAAAKPVIKTSKELWGTSRDITSFGAIFARYLLLSGATAMLLKIGINRMFNRMPETTMRGIIGLLREYAGIDGRYTSNLRLLGSDIGTAVSIAAFTTLGAYGASRAYTKRTDQLEAEKLFKKTMNRSTQYIELCEYFFQLDLFEEIQRAIFIRKRSDKEFAQTKKGILLEGYSGGGKSTFAERFPGCMEVMREWINWHVSEKNGTIGECTYETFLKEYQEFLQSKNIFKEVSYVTIKITANDLLQKYVGAGLENLQKIFERAKEEADKKGQYVAVVLDECQDFLKTHDGESGAHKNEIVDRFLTLLDGDEFPKNVVFIGTTNKPIDPRFYTQERRLERIIFPSPTDELIQTMVLTALISNYKENHGSVLPEFLQKLLLGKKYAIPPNAHKECPALLAIVGWITGCKPANTLYKSALNWLPQSSSIFDKEYLTFSGIYDKNARFTIVKNQKDTDTDQEKKWKLLPADQVNDERNDLASFMNELDTLVHDNNFSFPALLGQGKGAPHSEDTNIMINLMGALQRAFFGNTNLIENFLRAAKWTTAKAGDTTELDLEQGDLKTFNDAFAVYLDDNDLVTTDLQIKAGRKLAKQSAFHSFLQACIPQLALLEGYTFNKKPKSCAARRDIISIALKKKLEQQVQPQEQADCIYVTGSFLDEKIASNQKTVADQKSKLKKLQELIDPLKENGNGTLFDELDKRKEWKHFSALHSKFKQQRDLLLGQIQAQPQTQATKKVWKAFQGKGLLLGGEVKIPPYKAQKRFEVKEIPVLFKKPEPESKPELKKRRNSFNG